MKKAHLREIEHISKSIPKELLNRLMKKEKVFPVSKEIMERALTDPNVSARDKRRFAIVLKSGHLDMEIEVMDPEVEKEINDYLDKEFEKSRALGKLPPPQKMPNINKKAKKIYVQDIKTEDTK